MIELNLIRGDLFQAKEVISSTQFSVKDILVEKITSPGIYPFLQALIYFWNVVVASIGQQYNLVIVMLCYTIGALGFERLANLNHETKRKKSTVENFISLLFKKLPGYLRKILVNPGVVFISGNIILSVSEVSTEYLNSSLVLYYGYLLGIFISVLGILMGLFKSFDSNYNEDTSFDLLPLLVTSLGGLFLGAATFCGANVFYGVAIILWSIANTFYARQAYIYYVRKSNDQQ